MKSSAADLRARVGPARRAATLMLPMAALLRAATYAVLLAGAATMLVPFVWMLSSSLKEQREIFVFPPQWIPALPQWGNYREAMTVLPFHVYFLNTLRIEVGFIAGAVLSNIFPAYSFARLRWPGRDLVFFLLLGVLMLPAFVTLVPTFIMWSRLGGVDTLWPLILPAWMGNAFFVFLLRQFLLTIPLELEDAALIDGAGHLRAFVSVILPLVKPALAVVVIFSFLSVWNDFIHPLIYLNSPGKFTIALGLNTFIGTYGGRWDLLMAASTVTIVPVIAVFFFFQRYFIEGVALTGLKG